MSRAHQSLVAGDSRRGLWPAEPHVSELYFGKRQLDARVRSYLEDARAILDLPDVGPDHPLVLGTLNRANDALLSDLNEVVWRHEEVGSQRVRQLQVAQIVILALMFGLLWFEGRGIFRPMVRWVSAHTDALQREIGERRAAEERAFEASRAKDRFLAKMSHELRTPLNAVIGYTELLSEISDPVERVDCTDRVLNAAHHQLSMINDLLDLERVERGDWTLEMSEVDVGQLMGEVGKTMLPQCVENGNRLVVKVGERVPIFRTDRVRLSQVLINLIGNAAKFTQNGVIRASAHQRLDNGSPILALEVEDSGQGVPAEDLQRIFDKFVQLDDSATQRNQGVGLGLAITKEIIGALGCTIAVSSELGVGSTFVISLPYKPGVPSPSPENTAPHPPGVPPTHEGPWPGFGRRPMGWHDAEPVRR